MAVSRLLMTVGGRTEEEIRIRRTVALFVDAPPRSKEFRDFVELGELADTPWGRKLYQLHNVYSLHAALNRPEAP